MKMCQTKHTTHHTHGYQTREIVRAFNNIYQWKLHIYALHWLLLYGINCFDDSSYFFLVVIVHMFAQFKRFKFFFFHNDLHVENCESFFVRFWMKTIKSKVERSWSHSTWINHIDQIVNTHISHGYLIFYRIRQTSRTCNKHIRSLLMDQKEKKTSK